MTDDLVPSLSARTAVRLVNPVACPWDLHVGMA